MENRTYAYLVIPGEPTGKGRPRFAKMPNGLMRTYTPQQTASYENLIKLAFQTSCHQRFSDSTPIEVTIFAYYAIPSSASKKRKEQMLSGEIRPMKKPDFDNVAKIVCDSLNGIAYRDDVQVVDAEIHRFYSDEPRVEILLQVASAKPPNTGCFNKNSFGME